jgi:AraC-like DNA-binding protein
MPELLDGEQDDGGTVTVLPTALPGTVMLTAERSCRRWVVLHDTYTICTVLHIDDPVPWRYRGNVDVLGSDEVSFMEPGEVHTNLQVSASATFRVLFVDPGVVHGAARELGVRGPVHFGVSQVSARSHPELRGAMLMLHASLDVPGTALEKDVRFARCLSLLFEQCLESTGPTTSRRTSSAETTTASRARDYLDEHLATSVTLDELTEASGAASRFQLIRSFGGAVGLPPHAYQIQRRIMRSRSMLAAGIAPARVAAELGFTDQSHFARHFGRVLGVSPGAYRRAVAERKNVQDNGDPDREPSVSETVARGSDRPSAGAGQGGQHAR